MSLDEFLEEWNNPSPYVHVQTSGSTGAPKPMLVEKQRMLNSARITCDFLGLREGDTALLCMSLDYIAGKMMVVRSIERGLKLITVEPSGHPLYHDGVCSFASNDAKEQIPNNNPLPSMGRDKSQIIIPSPRWGGVRGGVLTSLRWSRCRSITPCRCQPKRNA